MGYISLETKMRASGLSRTELTNEGLRFDPSKEMSFLIGFIVEVQQKFTAWYQVRWGIHNPQLFSFNPEESQKIDFKFDDAFQNLVLNGLKINLNSITKIALTWHGDTWFDFQILLTDEAIITFTFRPVEREAATIYWDQLVNKLDREKIKVS